MESEDIDEAIKEYDRIRQAHPLKEQPYDRLMIMYRKTNNYNKEKKIIETAIKIFMHHYGSTAVHPKGKKVTSLSKALSHSLGLTDKKGQLSYDRGPIERWTKRKNLLEKRKKKI